MMPSEWGTPPETVHNTPVPIQVMHSSTLRRLTPSSRSDLLITVSPVKPKRWGSIRLLRTRPGKGDIYSRRHQLMIKRTSRGIQEINFKIASHGDVNRHIRLSAMKDYSELDPDDEVILTHAISDEALESAAG